MGNLPQVTDAQFLDLYLKVAQGAAERPSWMPELPPADLVRRLNGSELGQSIRHGFKFYQRIKSACMAQGVPLENAKVLDFGCGWGRHIRFLLRDVPAAQLFGTDVSERNVELCRAQIAGVNFSVNQHRPLLPFDDGTFDLIYAQSVLSHLPEYLHLHWLAEFNRILRPGTGLLIVTTYGADKFAGRPALQQILEHYGYAFLPQRSEEFQEWGETAITSAYVDRRWNDHVRVISYSYDRAGYPQAIVLCGRRQ